MKKISGPLLERIDLIVNIPHIHNSLFINEEEVEESSEAIKIRVIKARELQKKGLSQYKLKYNSDIDFKLFKQQIPITNDAKEILEKAAKKMLLSMRSSVRILRVAKSIANLDLREEINKNDILEALNYKVKD